MNNYILADIKRIFQKKSFLIGIGLYVLWFFVKVYICFDTPYEGDICNLYVARMRAFLGDFPLMVGLNIFLSVYYDDFKSKSMQVAIGYGLPRYKVILCKIIESFLLIFITSLFVSLIIFVTPILLEFCLENEHCSDLFESAIIGYFKTIGYISISAIPVFYTQNTTLGNILYVLFSSKAVAKFLTMFLKQDFIVRTFGDLTKYLFTSQLNKICSLFVETGTISVDLLWTILFYIIIPILLSIFIFNKKELEF